MALFLTGLAWSGAGLQVVGLGITFRGLQTSYRQLTQGQSLIRQVVSRPTIRESPRIPQTKYVTVHDAISIRSTAHGATVSVSEPGPDAAIDHQLAYLTQELRNTRRKLEIDLAAFGDRANGLEQQLQSAHSQSSSAIDELRQEHQRLASALEKDGVSGLRTAADGVFVSLIGTALSACGLLA